MNILALDTATGACSAAVWRTDAVAAAAFQLMDRGHAEALIPMVRGVMATAALDYADLDGIAVTVGPGYFTGIRIGLAAARGLALAADVPIAGFTTLAAIAHGVDADARAGRDVLVVMTSKRRELYAQRFGHDLQPLAAPRAATPETIVTELMAGDPLLAGDGAEIVRDDMAASGRRSRHAGGTGLPDAAILARTAAAVARDTWLPATPVYLRPPDVSPPAEIPGKPG